MSVRPCDVNIFKTPRLQDRWADGDEIWHVYSMVLRTKPLGSGILNFGPCAALGHPELSPVGRDDPPRAGCFFLINLINALTGTLKPQSNGPLYSNTVIGTLAVDG